MIFRNDLTAEYVRSIFDYNPETGEFRWKHRDDVDVQWNARSAGKLAGSIKNNGYRSISVNGRYYKSARLAWLWMTGAWPACQVDHKDRNKLNEKWDNLRDSTQSQNMANSLSSLNTSSFKGVSYYKNYGKWKASITKNYKTKTLGYFDTPEQAHTAYCNAAKEVHGEFARVA